RSAVFSTLSEPACRPHGADARAGAAQRIGAMSEQRNFHEVRFPADLSFGSVGGPERRTEIVTLANGYEERNSPWAQSRRRYDAGLGLRSLDDVAELVHFFEARAGQLHGFRWKDWADYRSGLPSAPVAKGDQQIGLGDSQVQIGRAACRERGE